MLQKGRYLNFPNDKRYDVHEFFVQIITELKHKVHAWETFLKVQQD